MMFTVNSKYHLQSFHKCFRLQSTGQRTGKNVAAPGHFRARDIRGGAQALGLHKVRSALTLKGNKGLATAKSTGTVSCVCSKIMYGNESNTELPNVTAL